MTDHTTPCDYVKQCSIDTNQRLENIERKLDTVLDMAEVFNDGKGFFKTVALISKGVAILGAGAAALAGIFHLSKHFGGN